MDTPERELQIPAIKQQLIERTSCLGEELEKLSLRLTDIKHPEPAQPSEGEVSKSTERVPLAADLYIVLERVNTSIGLVRMLLETMEI